MYARGLMECFTSNSILDIADAWICKTRKHAGYNNSIWDLHFTWINFKSQLIQSMHNNTYHLSFIYEYCNRIVWANGEYEIIT